MVKNENGWTRLSPDPPIQFSHWYWPKLLRIHDIAVTERILKERRDSVVVTLGIGLLHALDYSIQGTEGRVVEGAVRGLLLLAQYVEWESEVHQGAQQRALEDGVHPVDTEILDLGAHPPAKAEHRDVVAVLRSNGKPGDLHRRLRNLDPELLFDLKGRVGKNNPAATDQVSELVVRPDMERFRVVLVDVPSLDQPRLGYETLLEAEHLGTKALALRQLSAPIELANEIHSHHLSGKFIFSGWSKHHYYTLYRLCLQV